VGDGIVVTPNLVLVTKLQTLLKKDFDMTYEGGIYSVVGLWIICNQINKWFRILQDNYLNGVLHRYNMFNSHVIFTPLEARHILFKDDCPNSLDEQEQMALVPYAQVVGNLMHSSVYTRLDTTYTINSPAQFLSTPGHWH
jgi:hypothetical protein